MPDLISIGLELTIGRGVDKLHKEGLDGSGIIIAEIDTGWVEAQISRS